MGVVLVVLVVIGLAGCAGQTIGNSTYVALPKYVGQPTDALVGKLGLPSGQDKIHGRRVYVWTTSNVVDGTNYSCTVHAMVDDQDIIITADFQGNEGGCLQFASMLR